MQLKLCDHTKNAQMNSPYLSLLKKDLQTSTITTNDINENLARLTEIGKIKNKPSNNRNSYYLIDDSTDVTDSQTPILAITNTPIVEKNVNLDNSLNSVPDQIDSFISSDTEPDATDFSYKNIKYQKIKDILLKDMKKDMRDFMQNEIRQKINLYSLDEHRTLIDKRIIANLRKEIHFLKTEIETKNEIIKNFIKNHSHRNENNYVLQDGQIWESDEHEYERSESDSISTCDTYAAYDTRISSDSNTNEINTVSRNIDEQVKAIREEKHKKYLQNTSRKSSSQENMFIETNEKNDRDNEQPNDTHDNNEIKSEQNERDNQSRWPSGTCAIVGDSMVNGIDEKRLSQKYGNVKVFHFLGARIENLNHYIVPVIKNKPGYLILYVGTNDATTNSSRKMVDDLLMLKTNTSKQLPNCRIVLSKRTIRHDHGKANLTIRNVNKHLENLELESIDNDNINADHLGQKGLHLNPKGKGRLALNFFETTLEILKVGRTRK